MSAGQELARMLRQALLDDAAAVLRKHCERTAQEQSAAAVPEPAAPRAAQQSVPQPYAIPPPVGSRATPCLTPQPPLPNPEPPTLLTRARALFTRHLAEPPALLDTLILWALHTHAYTRFEVSPRLVLHARDPRAGHARALRVLRWLVPAPRLVARATAPLVLDLLTHEAPTLLLDDAANAILARRDMRALIAAGARADGVLLGRRTRRRDSAFRRCAAPLAIATAASPPEEMLTHAIVLPMAPALSQPGRAHVLLADPPPDALALREEFEAFAARLAAANEPPRPALPPFLASTAAETWEPLFAIAAAIGPAAEAAARAAASQFAAAEHLERPTSALALLRDVRAVTGIDDQPVASLHLIAALTREADSPWNACDWGAKLTPRGLAKRLARFDVRPQIIFPPDAPAFRGYKADALLTAYARYLADPVARALLGREP
jgi:hypothetical protein